MKKSAHNFKHYLFAPRYRFSRFQFNLVAVLFALVGMASATYFTAMKLPIVFAYNDTTKTWTFNTANAGTYTYDTALVTVDDSGARPVTGANKIVNPAFASDISSWSSSANAPAGWVEAPGDGTFSTSNFLVMKYEAKCAGTGTPTVGLTSPADATYEVYRDDGAVTPANNCTDGGSPDNNRVVASLASGYPIAYINQTEANTRCGTVAVGATSAHLITDPEWMTIATNAQGQNTNWSLGTVGNGYLYAGHNDNSPAKARVASSTDANRAAYTDAGGTTEALTTATNTAIGQSGTVGNQVRTLVLSNGSAVWDIAGNVWEWTNKIQSVAVNTTGSWVDWNHANVATGARALYGSSLYLSNQGTGQVYGGALTNGFLRGGYWLNTSTSGAFALYLPYAPSSRYYYLGFRCTSDPVAISQSYTSSSGRADLGAAQISVGTVADAKFVQSISAGDTATYDLSVYVRDATAGNEGGTVSSAIAELYYNGAVITTSYVESPAGSGWYKLSGTLTGSASAREYGLLVKRSKTILVDDTTLAKTGTYSVYTTSAYTNAQVSSWDSFTASVTATGNASVGYQICLDDGSACGYVSGSRWQYYTGGAWANATGATQTNTVAELTQAAMQALSATSQKISVKAIMQFGGANTPAISTVAIGLTTDTTPPQNTSSVSMKKNVSAPGIMTTNAWTNDSAPYFTWPLATDLPDPGGSGIKGYCLSLTAGNTNPNLRTTISDYLPDNTPATLDSTHITSADTQCGNGAGFLVSTNTINFATLAYRGTAIGRSWLTSSTTPYYLYVQAVDNAGNISTDPNVSFAFRFDNIAPSNPAYISLPSDWIATKSASLLWPSTGVDGPSDAHAQVAGLQYRIGATGTWYGDAHTGLADSSDLLANDGMYSITENPDFANIIEGSNTIYLRTWDLADNVSSAYISSGLKINTVSPSAPRSLAVTPSERTTNAYAFSWIEPSAYTGQTQNLSYCYTVNTVPTSINCNFTSNGASSLVSDAYATQPGTNTLYLVARDEAGNINYASYTSVEFTYSGSAPSIPRNIDLADISIKSTSNWKLAVSWDVPSSVGAGVSAYQIFRSTINTSCSASPSSFTQIGTTAGTSYSDTGLSQITYYYCVKACDSANSCSASSATVSTSPTGKYFSPATLSTAPSAGSITTKKAVITWSTDRSSDSKVAYGTSSGSYGSDEVSNSSQVTSHTVNLTNLKAGTTYFYQAKWTDEDGNTGTSDEKSFTTDAAPTVKEVSAKNVGLTSAMIEFTAKGASKVKIYYGTTTGFGGSKEVATSTSETTYTSELTGLDDGTKYFYKINTFDSESAEYEGTILDFTTLPRPKISSVRIQEVKGSAQPTVLVTWESNTEISSIVTYYPEGAKSFRDVVDVKLVKGSHKLLVKGLLPEKTYTMIVSGRDKLGNEAISNAQRFTTATDTRPPEITNVRIDGTIISALISSTDTAQAQITVTWDTDEPATGQVEYGEGTGGEVGYSQKTSEDMSPTYNHVVVISGLTPSKVYHLRAVSHDSASNTGMTGDRVFITPQSVDSALNLIIGNLSDIFGFIPK